MKASTIYRLLACGLILGSGFVGVELRVPYLMLVLIVALWEISERVSENKP